MKLTVACAQLEAVVGDVKTNLNRLDGLLKEGAERGCDLVVFPELVTCGYGDPETVASMAEPIPGPVSEILATLAREHGVGLAVGLPELDEQKRYNTMLLLDAHGEELARYRKVHLWDKERGWAESGDSFPVVDFQSVRTGMWICYDSRFPETGRALARQGASLGLVATAWLGPAEEWSLAIRSRALDNGMFVAASALLGKPFHGESLIVDPHGTVLAAGKAGETALVVAEVDLAVQDSFHQRVPILQDTRPGVYPPDG